MSKESAKAFVQAILEDEELREKTANMKPEDAVPLGKEMGYDFTLEEFTDVMNEDRELSPVELESVAGGYLHTQNDMQKHAYQRGITKDRYENAGRFHGLKNVYCPNGTPHNFVTTIEDRSYFLFSYTYEVQTCSLCGHKVERHIKFGEGGQIEYVD